MSAIPIDPRYRAPPTPVSSATVLAGIAVSAAIPVAFWAASHPRVGVALAVAAAVLAVGLRRAVGPRREGSREHGRPRSGPRGR